MTGNLILTAIITLALWLDSLYVRPFGRCHKCKGKGVIKRGPRRVKVCPRCKGLRRVQHHGSRTLHRLIFKIRDGRNAAARYRGDSHGRS
jgi:DnaJ-class molecular chaperone